MIAYATYYDHIERTGYDPARIVENWNSCDRRFVFVSCEEEATVCRARNVDAEIVIIDKCIVVI